MDIEDKIQRLIELTLKMYNNTKSSHAAALYNSQRSQAPTTIASILDKET